MKHRTLVADRRYYGLDPVTLRAAAGRVAARVAGLPPARARVRGSFLRQDFGLGETEEGHALLNEMCTAGLLERRPGPTSDFLVTRRMFELANARVVEPLPRAKAKLLVVRACELAERVNRDWARNPLEVAMVVPHGDYFGSAERLESLPLALVVRSRPGTRRAVFNRLSKNDGARGLKDTFAELSSFVRVHLVTALEEVPRPFTVAWQADED